MKVIYQGDSDDVAIVLQNIIAIKDLKLTVYGFTFFYLYTTFILYSFQVQNCPYPLNLSTLSNLYIQAS